MNIKKEDKVALTKKIADVVPMKIGEIRYSGVFDFDGLYKLIHGWLNDHCSPNGEVIETPYKHKMTGRGAEVELTISGERNQTEFVKYKFSVDIHIWNMTDVEVVKDGKKQKLNKGRFILSVTATCVFDWQKQFEGKPFYIRLFNLLRNTILKTYISFMYLGDAYYEAYKLHTEIKKFLGMETAYSAY